MPTESLPSRWKASVAWSRSVCATFWSTLLVHRSEYIGYLKHAAATSESRGAARGARRVVPRALLGELVAAVRLVEVDRFDRTRVFSLFLDFARCVSKKRKRKYVPCSTISPTNTLPTPLAAMTKCWLTDCERTWLISLRTLALFSVPLREAMWRSSWSSSMTCDKRPMLRCCAA